MAQNFPLAIQIQAVDDATATLAKVDRRIQRMGERIGKVGAKMTTHLTLPILGVGVASVASAAKFEQGMASVSTLIDSSTEDIDAMSRSVLDMGQRVSVPLADLTTGLYDVRSAGIGAGEAMTVLEKSAQLGVAGLGTTQEAVDLVTSSINAFKLEGAEAEAVYNNVFKAIKNGKTTIAGLSQGFGAVAGTVAKTGTELDEYLAAVAAMTTTGLPASQAHTQLRAVISGLTRPTKENKKLFRSLGAKDLPGLIKASGGLVPALEKINTKLGGNSAKIIDVVGSTEALNAILSLTGAQNEAFVATLADMREGTDALTPAFEKQSKTLTARWQRTKNTLVKAGVAISEVLAPALERVSEILSGAAEWFAGLDEGTQKFIIGTAAVVAAIGPAVRVVGYFTEAWVGLRKALPYVGKAFQVLRAVILANPIVALIAAVATAAYLIYENWEPIKEFFKLLWDGIKDVFASAWEFIKGIVDKVVGAVETVIDAAKDVGAFVGGSVLGGKSQEQLLAEFQALQGGRPRIVPGAMATEVVGGQAGAPGANGEARVLIELANAPRGTRVEQRGGGADVELDVGYQMGGL